MALCLSLSALSLSLCTQPVSLYSLSLCTQPVSLFTQPVSLLSLPVSLFTQPVSLFTQPVSLLSLSLSLSPGPSAVVLSDACPGGSCSDEAWGSFLCLETEHNSAAIINDTQHKSLIARAVCSSANVCFHTRGIMHELLTPLKLLGSRYAYTHTDTQTHTLSPDCIELCPAMMKPH